MKPWTPETISGMFIVSQPVTCDMKPRKITDKPLQGSVMTWYEATTWPFLLQESVFLLYLSGKKLHNIIFYQKPTLVTWFCLFEIKLPNWPKSECKLWKFTMVQALIIGKGFSGAKKYGSKTMHQSQPTTCSMTFWTTACETNTEEHCLRLAHFFFFSLSDLLSSCNLVPRVSHLTAPWGAVSDWLILSSWFNIAFL